MAGSLWCGQPYDAARLDRAPFCTTDGSISILTDRLSSAGRIEGGAV